MRLESVAVTKSYSGVYNQNTVMPTTVSADDPTDKVLGVEISDADQRALDLTGGIQDRRAHRDLRSSRQLARSRHPDNRLSSRQRGGEILAVRQIQPDPARHAWGVGETNPGGVQHEKTTIKQRRDRQILVQERINLLWLAESDRACRSFGPVRRAFAGEGGSPARCWPR